MYMEIPFSTFTMVIWIGFGGNGKAKTFHTD